MVHIKMTCDSNKITATPTPDGDKQDDTLKRYRNGTLVSWSADVENAEETPITQPQTSEATVRLVRKPPLKKSQSEHSAEPPK
jgi:hypothetical protein